MSKTVKKNERNETIDFVRGIAIILVVLAHCIQCGNGNEYYSTNQFFDDVIYKVVYSFHMPLLMGVSGWLFAITIDKRSILENFWGRVKSILLPIFVWNVLVCIRHLLSMNPAEWIKTYLVTATTSFWFLWAVFYASVGMLLIHALGKKKVLEGILVVFSLVITFVTPDIWNAECYKFMWPCFVIGFYACKYKEALCSVLSKFAKYKWLIIGGFLLLFVAGVLIYNRDSYIYTSGWTLLGKESILWMLLTDIYRVILGGMGSLLCIGLARMFTKRFSGSVIVKGIGYLGKLSMGIYIISAYCNIVLQRVTRDFEYNLLVTIVETIVILAGTCLITRIIQCNKWTAKLLLGGRR